MKQLSTILSDSWQTARKICSIVPEIPAAVMATGKASESFDNETRRLRQFFNLPQGFMTFVAMFLNAETQIVDEPAGVLSPDGMFEFFPISKEKQEFYEGVVKGDKQVIEKLAGKLEKRISFYKQENMGRDEEEIVLESLKEYLIRGNDQIEIIMNVRGLFKNYYQRPENRPKGIEVHVHPYGDTHFIRDGKLSTFRVKKGYSDADRKGSQNKSLGLVEYMPKIDFSSSTPKLVVSFMVSHRRGPVERGIGSYSMTVNNDLTTFVNNMNRIRTVKTQKSYLAKLVALKMLTESAYVLPFISYDANEDLRQTYAIDYDKLKGREEEIAGLKSVMDKSEKAMSEYVRSLEKLAKNEYERVWLKK